MPAISRNTLVSMNRAITIRRDIVTTGNEDFMTSAKKRFCSKRFSADQDFCETKKKMQKSFLASSSNFLKFRNFCQFFCKSSNKSKLAKLDEAN